MKEWKEYKKHNNENRYKNKNKNKNKDDKESKNTIEIIYLNGIYYCRVFK